MRFYLKEFCFLLVGTFVGLIVGYFGRGLFTLTWNGEVTPDIFSNLFSAIIIALLLQQILQKKVSDARIEKDIVIGELKEAVSNLKTLKNEVDDCKSKGLAPANPNQITSSLRQLANKMSAAKDFVEVVKYDDVFEQLEKLDIEYILYKQLLTSDLTQPYQEVTYQKQKRQYEKLNLAFQKMIVQINRL